LGNGLALGVALAALKYTGVTLFRDSGVTEDERHASKEELRKRFRRPVNETINELGEGRGMLTCWGVAAAMLFSPTDLLTYIVQVSMVQATRRGGSRG